MKGKEKGALLLEAMISLALIGLVAVSVVGSTANINIGWRRLKAETNAYDTIYSTYQILRSLNSTSWLNDHLNENILNQFETNYGSNTQFKLDFTDIQSIVVKGYDEKTVNGSSAQNGSTSGYNSTNTGNKKSNGKGHGYWGGNSGNGIGNEGYTGGNGNNNPSFQYYTYYIITYSLKNPSKTVKLPLTINYIAIPKVGE